MSRRAQPLQIGVQCDTTEETLERIAQHYVDAAKLIDQSGPYCTVEAHVGGITINFQGCRVVCSGNVKVERRSGH